MEPPPGLGPAPTEKRSRSRDRRRRRERKRSRSRSRRRRKERKRSRSNDRFQGPNEEKNNKPTENNSSVPEDWPGHKLLKETQKPKRSRSRSRDRSDRGRFRPTPRNAGLSNKIWVDGLKRGERQTIQVNFALRELFGKYGTVEDCDLKITTSARMKGQACITMGNPDEATEATRQLNGENFMDHGALKLEIVDPNRSYAKPKKVNFTLGAFKPYSPFFENWRGGRGGGRGGGR